MNNDDNKFDLDLRFGIKFEDAFMNALKGKIEVKAERDCWERTGNIAIEYECSGKPSGIAVTQAEHWVHVLTIGDEPYCYFIFPIDKIKDLARIYYKRGQICNGGDGNRARVILIPIDKLAAHAW